MRTLLFLAEAAYGGAMAGDIQTDQIAQLCGPDGKAAVRKGGIVRTIIRDAGGRATGLQ